MSGPKPKCTNTARINTKSSPLIPASTKKRTHVPEKTVAHQFQEHPGRESRIPARHQLLRGRQRSGQNQRDRRGLFPFDVQVVAGDDRRAEHAPRQRLLPARRPVPHRRRPQRERRVRLRPQRRQNPQAQRQGVRTTLGPRGIDPGGDRLPGRHDAHQRCRRRTPPLPERFYLPVGPCLSAGSGTLQRRIGRTQPPAQNLAGRTDALHIRPSAGRTGRHHPPQTQRNRSSARTRSRPILPPPLQRPRTGDARIPLGAERHPLRRVAAQVPGKGFRQRIHHCGHPAKSQLCSNPKSPDTTATSPATANR